MFCYISELDKINRKKKIEHLLKHNNINFYFDNDNIRIKNKIENQEYSLYYDEKNFYPQYLISNLENDSNEIMKIYENINNNIDEYDTIESIIYDIHCKTIIISAKKKLLNDCAEANITNEKNIIKFEKDLDELKEKFINEKNISGTNNTKTKIFSFRSNVEMLRDQILKLYSDSNVNIQINEFSKIQIFLTNFTFIGSSGLVVKVDLDMSCLNLLSEPPKISLSSNKVLKDNILKVICELKPFVDVKSWSIKYSISESVQNIFNMINTFGEIEQEFTSEFDKIINELEYLVSIKNKNISQVKLLELFDAELVNSKTTNKTTSTNESSQAYWKKGTGYGNSKTKEWDIDSYVKNLNDKKNKIVSNYNKFIEYLSINHGDKGKLNMCDGSIERVINLLLNYLENEELDKNCIIKMSDLIYNNFNKFKLNSGDKDKMNKINKFSKLLKLIEGYMEENEITHQLFNFNDAKKIIDIALTNSVKIDELGKLLGDQSFKMYSSEFKKFYYKNSHTIDSTKLSRLKKEFNIVKKSICVNNESSIFFWIEKNKLDRMRFIITGPADTPYDQGLYIFDMSLSENFPSKPPLVHFSNNGGVRFNPNLYDCGKVCLSLLGTWRGDKGESWNPATSTFFQLLVSIQSQILIEEPFFNEPGYESQIGKESGKKNSKDYNDNIRQYNLDYAINNLIEGVVESKSDYPEFDSIIRNYFKFKRERIITILNKWESDYNDTNKKSKFTKSKNKFVELSSKL